jgi:hypothetical protein
LKIASSCSVVLVDGAAEASSASYGSIHRDDDGWVVVGRQLLPALVRAVIIEVVQILADHGQRVSFVVDQQPVGALVAEAAPPPFDETVRPWCPWRDRHSRRRLDGMKERGLAPRDSRRDARGAHVKRRRRPHMSAEYDGAQVVGIDLHRRRTVIVRMTDTGERLDTVRIDNDPMSLAAEIAKAGESPQVVPDCTTVTPMDSKNDVVGGTVSASVAVAPSGSSVLAVTSEASGDNGDYRASSLTPASTWQVSPQTGDFSWTYPIGMPAVPSSLQPELSLSYSTASVDGRSSGTNSQGSWIGDGWDMWPGYVERTYRTCSDDKGKIADKAPNNAKVEAFDQCWWSWNASLSLNGRATELVKDGDVYRGVTDDGSKIELLKNSAYANGDDDHEYWKVTTIDGTQYFFGRNRREGWTAGQDETDSVWTAPVYGNHDGEPGHADKYADSRREQAWRWNLDYVVDRHGNTISYFYQHEDGAYGREGDKDKRTTYDRGGYLKRIEYGSRVNTEYTVKPAAQVLFAVADRCKIGATCDTDHPGSYPDTPWDQFCKSGKACTTQLAPTFWTQKRLKRVTTQVYSGSGSAYQDVQTVDLRHDFFNAGDSTKAEGIPMWLAGITRTGKVTTAGPPGTAAAALEVADKEIVFDEGDEALANRVDGPNDGKTELLRWRVRGITTETGAKIALTFDGKDCTRSTLPKPEANTQRCYPQQLRARGQRAEIRLVPQVPDQAGRRARQHRCLRVEDHRLRLPRQARLALRRLRARQGEEAQLEPVPRLRRGGDPQG